MEEEENVVAPTEETVDEEGLDEEIDGLDDEDEEEIV